MSEPRSKKEGNQPVGVQGREINKEKRKNQINHFILQRWEVWLRSKAKRGPPSSTKERPTLLYSETYQNGSETEYGLLCQWSAESTRQKCRLSWEWMSNSESPQIWSELSSKIASQGVGDRWDLVEIWWGNHQNYTWEVSFLSFELTLPPVQPSSSTIPLEAFHNK